MRFFIFFLLFWVAGIASGSYYIGRRLFGPIRRRAGWIAVGAIFLLPQITMIGFLTGGESTLLDLTSWGGYVALGLFSLLITGCLIRDSLLAVAAGYRWVKHRVGSGEVRNDRRKFIMLSTNNGIMGAAAILSGYGFYEANRKADIVPVRVALRRLPPQFEGFRIVQITDIHASATIKRPFIERIAGQVAELKADCIAFTGDLVDGSVEWLGKDVAPLGTLSAPHGKFFITGNHEYYSGAEQWIEEAQRLGFTVLLNEHRVLERNGGRVVLGGVTDFTAGQFIPAQRSDPEKAFAGAPRGLVRILLAHQPKSIFAAHQTGCDLQLSGHTHGGQFFPWNLLALIDQPYVRGLHTFEDMQIYVSNGTGYWGPPIRIGIPPEITLITLTSTTSVT